MWAEHQPDAPWSGAELIYWELKQRLQRRSLITQHPRLPLGPLTWALAPPTRPLQRSRPHRTSLHPVG